MQYQLRLFENGIEVSNSTVAMVPGANNFPKTGDVIGDTWRVVKYMSHSDRELCLEVERCYKLEEMKKEMQRLREREVIDEKALERARLRAGGRQIDPSNRTFAASLDDGFEKLKKRIAELGAKIEEAERDGQKS